jgi:hypothetical protein
MSDICRVRRQDMIRRAAREAALLVHGALDGLRLPNAAPAGPPWSLSQLTSAFGCLSPSHVPKPAWDHDHSLSVEQETFDPPV